MDSVWHSTPDSRSVPPKDVGATVLSPMSKNKSSDSVGLLLNPCAVPGSMAGPFVSSGVPLRDPSEVRWNPFESSAAASGIPWDSMRSLGWSVGPLGFLWGPSGNQVETKWEPNGTN